MGEISLKGLRFKAYHGYYDEEREKGNHFEVNITVKTNFDKASSDDDLNGTVDYEVLYKIIKDEMSISSKLLEHVVERMADRIMDEIPAVRKMHLALSKFNPPIGGECREAVVAIKRKRPR